MILECPHCAHTLESIKLMDVSTWVIDPEEDRYIEDRALAQLKHFCPRCGQALPESMFPEGIANWR